MLALLPWCVAVRGAAQAPAERDTLVRFRAELETVADSLDLLALEARMIDRARGDRDNALLHLRLGWLAYRLGEVTGANTHYDDAASEFEWAAELQPQWPYAWYGLGLAELALGESSVIPFENIRQVLGKDYLSKATAAFARAAEVDPAFAAAVVDLADAAMRQRIRPRLEVALGAVREAAATEAARVPAVQLARGRLERIAGNSDSSVVALHRYLGVGGDSGIGHLELARSLYFGGRETEGRQAYFAGIERAESERAAALYRQDAGWAATPEELAAFDRLTVGDRAPWLRRFWERRDLADVRAPGERLAEHHRRYFYALDHYRLLSRHRRYDVINPYRNEQQEFDDRGIIYLRHGEPDRRASFASPRIRRGAREIDVPPNESWLYVRPDRNLVFHFSAGDDVQDYKLVESLADVLGGQASLMLQSGAEFDTALVGELFASRIALDPVYQRLAAVGTADHRRVLAGERRAGSQAIRAGTTTDSYAMRFRAPLRAVVRHHVVGREAHPGGQLLLVFAVPGDALVPEVSSEGITYRVRLRVLAAAGGGTGSVFVDTLRSIQTQQPFGPGQFLQGFLTVPIAAGEYALRVLVAEPRRDAGDVLTEAQLSVPEFAADTFAVSDIVIGSVGSDLTWPAGSDTVHVEPLRRFRPEAQLEVYYELHGLEEGAPYRTRLEVAKEGGGSVFGWLKRLFGGGGPPISLTFEGVASGPTTRVLQTVDIGDLSAGQYRLRIRVENPRGTAQIERQTAFEVVGT